MQISQVWNQINKEIALDIVVEKDVDTRKAYMDTTRKFLRIIEDRKVLKEAELKTLKRIRHKVNDIWINYLYGRVNTASSQMQNLMHLSIGKQMYMDLFSGMAQKNQVFYRGRISKEPLLLESDFYHIPFDRRYLIGNQRYSLSGIPCLYLASGVDCVYAELGTKKDVHLCQMINRKDFSLFDVSMDIAEPNTRQEYLASWYRMPLKYACSIQALDNDGATFKTNYIIPQLVTATLYNMNTNYQGICYSSIKGRSLPMEQKINYVFLPVYQLNKAIYDKNLISCFKLSIMK